MRWYSCCSTAERMWSCCAQFPLTAHRWNACFSQSAAGLPERITSGVTLECLPDRVSGLQLLWRYNKEAVALRIAFFTSARPGGVAHTVLVRDIPGLELGTLPNRIEDTALRFLPRFIKRRLVVSSCVDTLCTQLNSVNGQLRCVSQHSLTGLNTEPTISQILLH